MADIKIVPYTWFSYVAGETMPKEILISHRNLGGRTPKAALFFGNTVFDTSAKPGTITNPVNYACGVVIGATDGVRQWSCGVSAANGVSKVNRYGFTNKLFFRPDPDTDGTTIAEFEFVAFVPNGVVIRQTKATNGFVGNGAFATLLNCIMFAGDDLQAYANITPALGAAPATTTINTVGFNPDAVLVGSYGSDFASSAQAFAIGFGCAVNDGSNTNRSILWAAPDAAGSNLCTQSNLTDAASGEADSTAAALLYKATINNFGGAGFDVVTDASAGNDKLGYLALKFGGAAFKLFTTTSPVATGVQSDTGPGFRPQFGLMCTSGNDAVDTPLRNDNRAGGFGVAAFSTKYAPNTAGMGVRMSTALANSSLFRYNIFYPDGTSNSLCRGKTPTFTANGWDINYVSANATARKGWALAVEKSPSTGAIDQTLPLLNQTLSVPNGPRRIYIFTGSGNLTVWDDWNDGNFRIYGVGGGQAGETADATRLYGGSGGCGGKTVAVSTNGFHFALIPGEVLTYEAADWMAPFMPPAVVSDDGPRGNDTWIKRADLSYVLFAPGGQNLHGNTTFQNDPGPSLGSGSWFQLGNTGAWGLLAGTGGGAPGQGGGGPSLPFIPGYSTAGNRTAGFGGYSSINGITLNGASSFGGLGAAFGGGGGAGFTDPSDAPGPEHRDGDLSSQTVAGIGGVTTSSAADGGSVGTNTLTDGAGEPPGTTLLGGNWWVTRNAEAAAPGAGAAGAGCEFDYHGLQGIPGAGTTKASMLALAASITDWNASLSGTPLGANGGDGAFPGGAGSGGSNSYSASQGDMGTGGRGAPGIIVFDYVPLNLPGNGEKMTIEDAVDANIIASGGLVERMSIVDVVDAQLVKKAKWLTIGGDARTSIFPN